MSKRKSRSYVLMNSGAIFTMDGEFVKIKKFGSLKSAQTFLSKGNQVFQIVPMKDKKKKKAVRK